MCLHIDKKMTLKGKRVHPNGMVKAWKVLSVRMGEKTLRSPYRLHYWKPGWNKSDRGTTHLECNEITYKLVRSGMHVFLDRDSARRTVKYVGSCVVPVYACKEDLIACGKKNIFKQYTVDPRAKFEKQVKEAVFTRVFLEKEDYDKATKRFK